MSISSSQDSLNSFVPEETLLLNEADSTLIPFLSPNSIDPTDENNTQKDSTSSLSSDEVK